MTPINTNERILAWLHLDITKDSDQVGVFRQNNDLVNEQKEREIIMMQ